MFNPDVFRDYDIRGIYPTELDEDTYYRIGRAMSVFLKVERIAVGRDMRLSSPQLFAALVDGITDQGVEVIDLGLISTEMHYFASGKYEFPANAMVSASHNPPEYNGLKIVTKGVVALHGEYGLPEIRQIAEQNQFTSAPRKGDITQQDILQSWVDHALSFVNAAQLRPLKVVLDTGSGMGGIAWTEVAKRLPISLTSLHPELDGTFPYHPADPSKPANIVDLQQAVRIQQADIGIALDGDADRIFLIDETGEPVSSTAMTAMLAEYLLQQHGRAAVLYNVIIGRRVPEVVSEYGGTPVRVRVGHSFIKQYMKDYNAVFAGEHSGHYYFRDNYKADSSLIAGLLVLQFLSMHSKPLSEVVDVYASYPQSGEINFTVPDRTQMIAQIRQVYSSAKIDEIDGLTFWYEDWWFNLRASKTEPLLRLNIEANNDDILTRKVTELVSRIEGWGAVRKT